MTKYMTNDFKTCARLIGSASDDQLNKNVYILKYLYDHLLQWAFRTAIFSADGTLRPLWRKNVEALGQVDTFDVQTCELILSFVEPQENIPFPPGTMVKLICLPDNSFVSKYKGVPIRYSETAGCLVIDYKTGWRYLDSVVCYVASLEFYFIILMLYLSFQVFVCILFCGII